MHIHNPQGLEIFKKTPPFENPIYFDENGKNTYFKNKGFTPCNWVFSSEEDFLYQHTDTTVIFDSKFELIFDENPNNIKNRQYLELEDGRICDVPAVFTFSFGERFRGSKITNIYEYNEFIQLLRNNKNNSIANKLES